MRSLSVIIVTGLSGSGKSKALAALEDLGFFCVDNLPPMFLSQMEDVFAERKDREKLAIGIDVRVRGLLEDVTRALESLRKEGHKVTILFLDCSDEVLVRRFSETRRPHPLSESGNVPKGITAERMAMSSLREMADIILDTTQFNVHELRRELVDMFGPSAPLTPRMRIRVISFGFKYGVPTDADLVFDVRFLPNPYFVDELRNKTGIQSDVSEFVFNNNAAEEFINRTESLLKFLIPLYEHEGRAYLTVAIGCTGGKHRSVSVAEKISIRIKDERNLQVTHRDISIDASIDVCLPQNEQKEAK